MGIFSSIFKGVRKFSNRNKANKTTSLKTRNRNREKYNKRTRLKRSNKI